MVITSVAFAGFRWGEMTPAVVQRQLTLQDVLLADKKDANVERSTRSNGSLNLGFLGHDRRPWRRPRIVVMCTVRVLVVGGAYP